MSVSAATSSAQGGDRSHLDRSGGGGGGGGGGGDASTVAPNLEGHRVVAHSSDGGSLRTPPTDRADRGFRRQGPTSRLGQQQPTPYPTPGTPAAGGAGVRQKSNSGSSCNTAVKWVVVAAALTALAVGVIGLLVYLGHLQIAWAGAGAMTQTTGLYTLLAGAGAAGIITILLGVKQGLDNRSRSSEQPRAVGRGHASITAPHALQPGRGAAAPAEAAARLADDDVDDDDGDGDDSSTDGAGAAAAAATAPLSPAAAAAARTPAATTTTTTTTTTVVAPPPPAQGAAASRGKQKAQGDA